MISITIDCEQWNAFSIRGKEDSEDNNTKYSFEGNKLLLKVLDKYKIPSTFFTTGIFAKENSKQLKEISKKHEIACHGNEHNYRENKELDLEKDILQAKKQIEKSIGKKIIGFRAPQLVFSKKLMKTLEKLNFKYDSSACNGISIYKKQKVKYPLKPFKVGKILEIPASSSFKYGFPLGWIFIRNLPLAYTKKIIKNLLKRNIPVVIYIHSWEFVKLNKGPVPGYVRNTGIKFAKKLEKLIEYFKEEEFVTMKEIYERFKEHLN